MPYPRKMVVASNMKTSESVSVREALRLIMTDIVPDDSSCIDEDRYCYGLDVLHAHEIDDGGPNHVKYRYIGTAMKTGPHKGELHTHLPLQKGHQFRWCYGFAEVVSVGS
jgi:hypothetical protein